MRPQISLTAGLSICPLIKTGAVSGWTGTRRRERSRFCVPRRRWTVLPSPLLPGETLAEPAAGISITAAGYAGGYFHIQICRGDATQTDHHARLWLEGPEGTKCFSLGSIGFCRIQDDGSRADYTEFLFDVAPEALSRYTLHGDFYTASQLTEGLWQVTFPLVETP